MSDTAYELKIDLPEGDPIQIPGLGTFETGKTYEISKDEAEGYRQYWKREGKLGPTLLQASKKMYRVLVTVPSGSKPEDDEEPEADQSNADKTPDEGSDESEDKNTEGGAQ
jgi:hypothetical protein